MKLEQEKAGTERIYMTREQQFQKKAEELYPDDKHGIIKYAFYTGAE